MNGGRPSEQRAMPRMQLQPNVAPQMLNIPVPQQISWPQTAPAPLTTANPVVLGQIVEMSSGVKVEVCNHNSATYNIFAMC